MDGVKVTREEIKIQLDHIGDAIDRMEKLLTGNGDPAKGLVVRVDRLEQTESRRKWQIRTLAASFLGGAVSWVWKNL